MGDDYFHPRPVFSLNITNKCNMSCKHCYREFKDYSKTEPSKDQILRIIGKISINGGTIIFHGGEPFIREDFHEIVDYASSKEMHLVTRCNGTLIDEEILEKVQGKIREVRISLEGASDRTHDYIRGQGSFKKAVGGFELLKRYSVPSSAGITLNKINIGEISKFFELFEKYDCSRLSFGQLIPRGKARTIGRLCLSLDDLRKANDCLSELEIKYPIGRITKMCTISGFCNSEEIYVITSSGKIGPCFIREDLAMGDVSRDNLEFLLKQVNEVRRKNYLHASILDTFDDYKSIPALQTLVT